MSTHTREIETMLAVEDLLVRATLEDGASERPVVTHSELEAQRRRVPVMVDRIGRLAWERRTSVPVPLVTPPPVSRAYYKMVEIQKTCGLRPPTSSLHLCEAPGGFVQAVSHMRGLPDEWTWTAISLGGEGVPAFRFPGRCLEADVRAIDDTCSLLTGLSVDLVTADGAVEMDHSCSLEEVHWPLLEAQTRVALRHLTLHGELVIKFFEGEDARTRLWLARLTTRFVTVGILKPWSSRATNSERYVVCRGFQGDAHWPDHCQEHPCESWSREVDVVLERLARKQTSALAQALCE